jgi:hypothetical protein
VTKTRRGYAECPHSRYSAVRCLRAYCAGKLRKLAARRPSTFGGQLADTALLQESMALVAATAKVVLSQDHNRRRRFALQWVAPSDQRLPVAAGNEGERAATGRIDLRGSHCACLSPICRSCQAPSTGSHTRARSPFPGLLASSTSPSWETAAAFAIASPSPKPPVVRLRELSAR